MSKHNYFVIFLKKINLSINNLLKKYLNRLKFQNLLIISRSNKVFLTFVALTILFLSYLSIPHTYDKGEISKELENQLKDKFNLNFVFKEDFQYKFFPRPHFIITDSFIIEKQKEISQIKELSIYVSLDNLFSKKNMIIKDVIIENANFNLNNQNYNFFINLLDANLLENNIKIKNSNVFFRNNDEEVLFINKIKKINLYYDIHELRNNFYSDNEIFNISYSLNTHKVKDKKKLYSKINFNLLKLQIQNQIDYSKTNHKGLVNFIYDKDKSEANYQWDKNSFSFNWFDKLSKSNFNYKGHVNFNPFYSNLEGDTNKINLVHLFKFNSLTMQIFKSEILNNKNLNIDLSIKSKKIDNYENFINILMNLNIKKGLIDFDKTKFSWKKNIDFEISDSLIYVNENQLMLDCKITAKIIKYNEIYKFLQTPKNLRPELNKIEFNFSYNFDQQEVNFDEIKINDKYNKKVNDILNQMSLKKDKLQNKIYFKNIMKKTIMAYAG